MSQEQEEVKPNDLIDDGQLEELAKKIKGLKVSKQMAATGANPDVTDTPKPEHKENEAKVTATGNREKSLLNSGAPEYTPSTAQRRENPKAILRRGITDGKPLPVDESSKNPKKDKWRKRDVSPESKSAVTQNLFEYSRTAAPTSTVLSPTEKILMEKMSAVTKEVESLKKEKEQMLRTQEALQQTQEALQMSVEIAERRWGDLGSDNESVASGVSRASKTSRTSKVSRSSKESKESTASKSKSTRSRMDDITLPHISNRLTPLKVFESITRSKSFNKVILKSDFNTFPPWKEYINSVLEGCWLISLAKMNIYKIPPEDQWKEWDLKCREGVNISRRTYDDLKYKINEQIPVVSYLDDNGEEQDFDITTNVDILNCATLMLFKKWPGIEISIYQHLRGSVDRSSMSAAFYPKFVPGRRIIMKMYVTAHLLHQHNSFTMVQSKITNFNSVGSFKMHQGEPPNSFIKRLHEEADVINSMATKDNVIHITDEALFAKFLLQVRDMPMYSQVISQLEIGWKNVHGVYQEYTLAEYASHMTKIYLDKKEKNSNHHDHRAMSASTKTSKATSNVNTDDSDDQSTAMVATSSSYGGTNTREKSDKPCYQFRDKGVCKYGNKCKFVHDKSKTAQKAFLSRQDQLEQDVENLACQVQHYKKKFRSEKKMADHQKKIKERNAQDSSKKSSSNTTKVPGGPSINKANVAVQGTKENSEDASDEGAESQDDIQSDIDGAGTSSSEEDK